MCINLCINKFFGLQMEGIAVSPSNSSLTALKRLDRTSPASSSDKTDNHDSFETIRVIPDSVSEDNSRDMRREEDRLKTFENWPVSFLSPELLAKNGFYYLGRGDEVRCAFCKVEIIRWVEGDDPAKDHKLWAPQCPFLRMKACSGNVPLEGPSGRDECGLRAPPASTPISMPSPVHQKYASQSARLRTFKTWPRSMRQKPEDLADAGFFYTGQGDRTKCFYCDGGLKDWEEDDVPWEQHARWFSRCQYVRLVKGKDYVQRVISESCTVEPNEDVESKQETPKEPETAESTVEDTKMCKICYAEERNICFVPCGHVVACAKCALANDKCPMCRTTIQCAQRLYFP